MTFEQYLTENNVNKEVPVAVGNAARSFMRGPDNFFEESEKAWVNDCIAAADRAMELYKKKKRLIELDKLLPKI